MGKHLIASTGISDFIHRKRFIKFQTIGSFYSLLSFNAQGILWSQIENGSTGSPKMILH